MWIPPKPTRISRFYPLFALVLLISNSVVFFAWQSTQIELTNLSQTYTTRQESLNQQVVSLKASSEQSNAKLLVQETQIEQATAKLATLTAETESQKKALTDSQQQLADAQTKLANQQDQLAKNADELQQLRARPPLFSFANLTTNSNIPAEEAQVKDLVSNAYTYIQNVYGPPYLLNQITITFVNTFDISEAAGEIVISNSSKGISVNIHLKSFDQNNFQDVNTVIHEMIHAFHGVAVFDTSALEEGITVAATDVVMQNMINDGKLQKFPRLYLATSDSQYSIYNTTLTVPSDSTTFYQSPQISEVYQLIGVAWTKLYQQDPTVFKDINDYYYPLVQKGGTPNRAMVLEAIKHAVPTVGSQPIDSFLQANKAFNPT